MMPHCHCSRQWGSLLCRTLGLVELQERQVAPDSGADVHPLGRRSRSTKEAARRRMPAHPRH
eukprot:13093048-Heterocapsa_arctica.AAC.1